MNVGSFTMHSYVNELFRLCRGARTDWKLTRLITKYFIRSFINWSMIVGLFLSNILPHIFGSNAPALI